MERKKYQGVVALTLIPRFPSEHRSSSMRAANGIFMHLRLHGVRKTRRLLERSWSRQIREHPLGLFEAITPADIVRRPSPSTARALSQSSPAIQRQ
jgi:hypothetical protein